MLPLSIGDGELCETAVTTVAVPEMFRYWLQGGRITIGFLGAAQLDKFGNINTTVIGDYAIRRPGFPAAAVRRRSPPRRRRSTSPWRRPSAAWSRGSISSPPSAMAKAAITASV
ncbi:hypothetical protein AJ88_36185 [Mesorhizobium amorphae CCBAU 01583]|nr:hypothetical protein AJ88_36185 [Mesorhizobium amorphae CCBAU 01583]